MYARLEVEPLDGEIARRAHTPSLLFVLRDINIMTATAATSRKPEKNTGKVVLVAFFGTKVFFEFIPSFT